MNPMKPPKTRQLIFKRLDGFSDHLLIGFRIYFIKTIVNKRYYFFQYEPQKLSLLLLKY